MKYSCTWRWESTIEVELPDDVDEDEIEEYLYEEGWDAAQESLGDYDVQAELVDYEEIHD